MHFFVRRCDATTFISLIRMNPNGPFPRIVCRDGSQSDSVREAIEWCAMNPDQKLIQSAHEDAIKGLYAKLFEKYAEAGSVPADEQEAEQNFSTGVTLARRSRDRAVALLG